MTAERLLGIDLGTGSVKAVLTTTSGQVLAVASQEYQVCSPHQGWAETDPAQWWAATVDAVRRVLADPAAAGSPGPGTPGGFGVLGIGLSGQMHGVTLTAADGAALRPAILHADGRAIDELAAYRALEPAHELRLANPLSPNMAGPMLCWLLRHEPALVARARWALQPKDWLRLQLTGEVATDASDACATLLYDVPADRWDEALAASLGIDPALLPAVRASCAVGGRLRPVAARMVGLPPGIPVAVGAADTAAGALGTGLCRPGQTQLTVGTSAQLITMLSRPTPTVGVHCYRTATPVGDRGGGSAAGRPDVPSPWYAMGAVLNAGLALNWVRIVLNAGWQEVYAAAAEPPRPQDPLFLPHLSGERTPYVDPTLRAAWTGLSLGTDRTAMLRAALEGVAFAVRGALDCLPRVPGDPPASDETTPVGLVGGGTTDPGWRQMLADIVGRPLAAYDVPVASGRGAALLAGVAVGVLSWEDVMDQAVRSAGVTSLTTPRPQVAARYASRRERFDQHVRALRGT
ncbi:MAG: xylulose kinase [Austwickia sp.]|nr:xylulose kinase [Austwickia sp.]